MSTINERVKEIRLEFDLTQEDFGKTIGLSKSGISNIENGIRDVSIRLQKLICIKFGINEKWLKSGEGKKFISDEVKALEGIINYLKSIGFMVEITPGKNQKSGYWHEDKDDAGNIINKSWISDEEYCEVTLFKHGKSTSFSYEELLNLQKIVKETIEYQIWLKNK